MCVIVVKNKGQKFPTVETLRNCWRSNPDGAGFMFAHDGKVHIRKGFMTWGDFNTALEETRGIYGDELPYVLHFRIATHGAISSECCHPFPLSDSIADLKLIEACAEAGIAHNGIIPNRKTSDDVSDTMDYIANFIHPLSRVCEDWTTNKNARRLIDDTLKSKLAVLLGDGSISIFGEFERFDGCLFSNGSYKSYKAFSPFEMFAACEYCECFEDCEAYGCYCKSEEDATDNCVFDETLFTL